MGNNTEGSGNIHNSTAVETPFNGPRRGPRHETHSFTHPRWPVFYLDNHLLILYKPAGLLTQGDETGDPSLLGLAKGWIKEKYHKPGRVYLGMVHRLDRPAAGVVAFGRTSKAAARLTAQFREGATVKRYLAVVGGRAAGLDGELVDHLEKRGRNSVVVARPTAASREARLTVRALDTTATRSLLEIDLDTGRRHQIRVQLAHRGHPILGDLRYGASAPLPNRQIALLARELTVEHPTLKTPVTVRCPAPRGWPWDWEEGGDEAAPFWEWEAYR